MLLRGREFRGVLSLGKFGIQITNFRQRSELVEVQLFYQSWPQPRGQARLASCRDQQIVHHILIGMLDAIFIGLGDNWLKGLCCGKLMGYFFAKTYSFQEGFAMI
jgi:hypothetical protein